MRFTHIVSRSFAPALVGAVLVGSATVVSAAPDNITGLQVWLKTDNFASLGLVDGQGLSTWQDSSGPSTAFVQARALNAANFPTAEMGAGDTLNGFAVVRFANSTGNNVKEMRMEGASNAWLGWDGMSITSGVTMIAVVKPDSSGLGPLMSDQNGTLRPLRPQTDATSTFRHANSVSAAGFNDWRIVSATQSNVAANASNDMKLYMNGSLANSGTVANSANTTVNKVEFGTDIEALPNRANWSGDIAEIIIYDSALNDTDRYAVESYLAQKYGLTIVPEPVGLSVLMLGGTLLLRQRRRGSAQGQA